MYFPRVTVLLSADLKGEKITKTTTVMLLLRTFNWLLRLIRMHESQLDRFLLNLQKRIKGNRIIFDVKPTLEAFLTAFLRLCVLSRRIGGAVAARGR